MSEKAKEFLDKCGLEMVEYYLSDIDNKEHTIAELMQLYADKEIQKLNLERLMEVEQYEARIKKLEEGLRESIKVLSGNLNSELVPRLVKLLNQNKDERL